MNISRPILLFIFSLSLLFLWDKWQVLHGRPPLLPGMSPATETINKTTPPTATSSATADNALAATGVPSAAGTSIETPAPAAEPAKPSDSRVQIATDTLRVDIDPKGAVVARVELLKQKVAADWTKTGLLGLLTGNKATETDNVVLLEWNAQRVYLARSGLTAANGARLPNHLTAFTPVPGQRELAPDAQQLEVAFVAEAGGARLTKTFVFHRGRYDVEVQHKIENLSSEPITPSVYLQLVRDGNKPEGESSLYHTFTGPAVYTDAAKFQKIDFSDIGKKSLNHAKEANNGWLAMIQHYFVSAWVPPPDQLREYRSSQDAPNLYSISAVMPLPSIAAGAQATTQAALWVGPQYQEQLAQLAPGLDLVSDYGLFTIIAKPLFYLLKFLHGILGNWGWAIVLATLLIKLAFYPLSAASYKSMGRMKELTPRLMKIREQYANDKQKMNMAMMELYKNEKINPVGGCLPIVIQIPVFIAYYWVILASVEMRDAPWILWVHDLTTPDPWFILPVIMVATMWLQYKLNPTPPDPMQAKVMAMMPFIFGVMFFFFPSGLVLYWLVNNALSIAQQWYVTRQIQKPKAV